MSVWYRKLILLSNFSSCTHGLCSLNRKATLDKIFHVLKQISISTCATLTKISPLTIQSSEIGITYFMSFQKGKLSWRILFINSLEFYWQYFLQMLLSLLKKKNKEKDLKKYWDLIWGKGSERLGKNPRVRDAKFTDVAFCFPSSVPSRVLGALKEYEKRERQDQ